MSKLSSILKYLDEKQRTEISDRLRLNNDFTRGNTPGEFASITGNVHRGRNSDGKPYHIVGKTKIGGPNYPRTNVVGP